MAVRRACRVVARELYFGCAMNSAAHPLLRTGNALLLACSRTHSLPDSCDEVLSLVLRNPDWDAFYRNAFRHRVVPVVHRRLALARQRTNAIPESVHERFATAAARIGRENLRMAAELGRIAGELKVGGVETIAYNGPALALRASGDLGLRHFVGLDILVRERDRSRAGRLLEYAGYSAAAGSPQAPGEASRRWGEPKGYLSADGTLIDLHWRFTEPLLGANLPEDQVWAKAERLQVGSAQISLLSALHEMFVVATHGAGHGWSQLSWLCDLAELCARNPDSTQNDLLDLGRRHRCGRTIRLALYLAHELLNAPLSTGVQEANATDRSLPELSDSVTRVLFDETAAASEYARLQLALRERPLDRLIFALRSTLVPTPADVRATTMSPALLPLYYVAWPVRIALKHRPRIDLRQRLRRMRRARYRVHPEGARFPLWGRHGTSDFEAYRQVFMRDAYSHVASLPNVRLVIDGGANVGYASAFFLSSFPDARVIAVEPDRSNFRMLERNLRPYGDRARLVRGAIWPRDMGLVLSETRYRDGREWACQVREPISGERPQFRGFTIDSLRALAGYERVSLLKLDIEGAEAELFSGDVHSWLVHVDAIAIELHDDTVFGPSSEIFFGAIADQAFVVERHGEHVACRREAAPV